MLLRCRPITNKLIILYLLFKGLGFQSNLLFCCASIYSNITSYLLLYSVSCCEFLTVTALMGRRMVLVIGNAAYSSFFLNSKEYFWQFTHVQGKEYTDEHERNCHLRC